MKAIINGKLVFPDEIREGNLLIDGDRIVASGDCDVPADAELIDAKGLYVGPGLFDQHCHGYKQYGEIIDIVNDVRTLAEANLKHGTTSITPSIAYSQPRESFLHSIDLCNAEIARSDSSVVGIHFEGPFTNPLHGANSELAWQYSEEGCTEIFERAGKNVLHVTYAPEMPHAREFEKVMQRYGVKIDIGHTRADPESLYRSVREGASIVTHLFDAMGNYKLNAPEDFNPRGYPQESVAEILLSIPGLYYELICDSRCCHVRPSNIRLTLRAAGEDHVICISDATGRTGQLNPDDYPPEDRRSAKDLNFNQRGQLSGSRLTVSQSVAHFMEVTGCDLRVAFKVGSTNSAKALGLYADYGSIHAGKFANLVFVDEKFTVQNVIFKGNVLPEVRS